MSTVFIPNDSPWSALHFCFWVQDDQTNRLAANRHRWQRPLAVRRSFIYFAAERLVVSNWHQKTLNRAIQGLSIGIKLYEIWMKIVHSFVMKSPRKPTVHNKRRAKGKQVSNCRYFPPPRAQSGNFGAHLHTTKSHTHQPGVANRWMHNESDSEGALFGERYTRVFCQSAECQMIYFNISPSRWTILSTLQVNCNPQRCQIDKYLQHFCKNLQFNSN